jgi:hypothetical protein
MKRLLPLLLASMLAGLLAGCDTFARRAQARADTFAALDPATRAKLEHGTIEIGYTPDMVYIALGEPDEKSETVSAATREETWIYNTYRRDYAGTAHAGYRRFLVYDPKAKRYRVYSEPVYADVYELNAQENIRVIFTDGKVSALEQPKPPAAN